MKKLLALFAAVLAVAAWAQQVQSNAEASKLIQVPPDVPADAQRYTVLTAGNRSGLAAEWTTPDAIHHVFYAYNDRGRGPRVLEQLKTAPDGTITDLHITGNDYLKTPIEETFTASGESARWKNQAEEGSKPLKGPGFYIAMNGSPSDLGLLARALLRAGGSLPMLPAGEARMQKLRDLNVTAGEHQQAISAYAITGLDLTPTVFWLDKQDGLFAVGGSWNMIVREGWEASTKAILDAQTEIERTRAAELAHKLAHKPAGPVVIDDVSLFDSANARIIPHQTVVISGDRIQAVAPAASAKDPAGAQHIDGRGKMLLPGLWDMHAHVSPNDGPLNLAAGITTVRDMGNDNEELAARRQRIDAGEEAGTRIIPAGFIDGPGPYQAPIKILAATEQEARAWVRKYAAMGYPQIKIYSSLKPELVPAIIDEAHKRGLRVSGHIPAQMIASECVRDGLDEIQHMNYVFLNFMPDVKMTQTPARFTEPAKRSADLDLQSQPVRDFIALLKQHKVAVDPTLNVFEVMFTGRPGKIMPGYEGVADRLPAQVRRGFLTGNLPVPEGMDQRYRDSFAKFLAMTKLLYDSGVPIESGTDAMAGFAFDRELELHVMAGIAAARVLQDATLGAARIMKRDSDLGSIAPGKLADVMLVEGNPASNISDIRRTVLTMKGGVIYRPEEIYPELGIAPR